tara:strand:- start:5318 stop:6040 length:723 start_codon:yes stop_codon:yes gene_type:complete
MDKSKIVRSAVIMTFVTLYLLVSIISTIHVVDFFELSNSRALAITLAIAFEVGAAASLASLVILDKMNKTLVWALFITITLMQMQGNMYYAFKNLEGFEMWSQLFDLIDEDLLFQKRVLAAVSGAILPLVALGFIKSLVDYIKPEETEQLLSSKKNKEHLEESIKQAEEIDAEDEELNEEMLAWKKEIEEESGFDEDWEDEGPPWYDEEGEDLLDIATKENEKKKRDSFLNSEENEDTES